MNITQVGVIGVGQMGSGIAQVCAASGYTVVVYDKSKDNYELAKKRINKSLEKFVSKGKLSEDDAAKIKEKITFLEKLEDIKESDLVIEAIIENVEIKLNLFKEVSNILRNKDAIIASNTSSISITKLATAVQNSSNFIGIHFMNPVPIMKLVEIIRGLQTSEGCYQTAVKFVESLDKISVEGIDRPGFVVNRILCPMINEAIFLVAEGVKPEDIDKAMKLGTNHPMGPLELADFVGLDTLHYILQILHRELGEDKYRPCPLLTKYVEAGWYGRKSGRGFYIYNE
ncbi:MAG: 3-hydroxybutyryl-CoA dehydrogenase [Candidatus Dadabacteria bacterium]|nr:MAG: 3-hydroxybutyryl-CoA dehydrogenase [Candidatus Dadabacteria bacterium]